MENQKISDVDLKEYHLLWKENSDRLNQLELLRALAEAEEPLTQSQMEELFLDRCILCKDQSAGQGSLNEKAGINRSVRICPEDLSMADSRHKQAWENYFDYRARITPILAENRRRMCRIEEKISSLPAPLEREVLRLRYLDGCGCRLTPWKLVALRLYGDDDTAAVQYVRRLHDMAVHSLTAA